MTARLLLLLCLSFPAAAAEPQATSESRDASAAYVLTTHFVVLNSVQRCFRTLGRSDNPEAFVGQWRKRNAGYLVAAIGYMDRRLAEAAARGGERERERTERALDEAVSRSGTETADGFFRTGDKAAVCARVIGMIESGALDLHVESPMQAELQALVNDFGTP